MESARGEREPGPLVMSAPGAEPPDAPRCGGRARRLCHGRDSRSRGSKILILVLCTSLGAREDQPMDEHHVPVLVVGGSLVGLTMSALLAKYGVANLVVESHPGTAIHPRAASFHQRTMEVFRSVGLQREVEEAAAREFRQGGAIVAVESLGGKELAYFYRSYNDGVEGLSPADRLFVTQVGLEPILRRRATDLGAQHLFGFDLVSFEQQDDQVVSVIRPHAGGAEQVVTSDYLVAADGAHSEIREHLGTPMDGRGSFADCVTIYFRAEINDLMRERNLSVVYVNNPGLTGFFRFSITGDSGFLAVFATLDPEGRRDTHVGQDISAQQCADLVRTALGADAARPISVESVQRWSAMAVTARSFRSGRVFLAGDSAHAMPPTGGFGGNTGVADAHNLAWKLAFVTRGLAGAELLETYDAERRPICALTVEQAYTRYALRVDPSLPRDDLMPPLDDAAIELGAIYRSTAVHAEGPPESPLDDPHGRSWAVGARVPHVMLPGTGGPISTLDTAEEGFALLVEDERAGRRELVNALGIPVAIHALGPGGAPAGGALLRPDGVIAWKPDNAGDLVFEQLPGVLSELLSRR
ncbi:FAD-dependent monooxygenase [Actinoplanes sp. CA-142083]|uniref:FAD-dependent monooxygenase n=1 Tax=Actinoplanes sp. CA-142083 TaxID=3239903 RepID=UPI003D8ED7AE